MAQITKDEQSALLIGVHTLRDLATLLEVAATADSFSDANAGLEALVPSGNLDSVAGQIAATSVISDEDLSVLMQQAENAIARNSRLNGVLLNIASVVGAVRTMVLPLLV